MKQFSMLFLLLSITAGVMAQSNNVVSAHMYWKHYNTDKDFSEIEKAHAMIEQAKVHEKTMNDAKTWFYRGHIFLALAESNEQAARDLAPNALSEAYDSYVKALSLDQKNNFSGDINRILPQLVPLFINQGVDAYTKKEYGRSLALFEKSIDLNKRYNRVDTIGIYNAALSAEKNNDHQKALDYYTMCMKANYGGASVYSFVAQLHRNMNDTAKAVSVIQQGRKAYPEDRNLIIEELNFYLLKGQNREAIENLNLAIKSDPNNHVLYSSLGVVYDNMSTSPGVTPEQASEYIIKSDQSYKKALEIKPDYVDALFNLGALHINQGVKIVEIAGTIKDNAKYAKEVKRADEHFAIAMPYLEKALELNPDDPAMMKNIMLSLKQLYARMGMDEKFNAINARLKN